MVLTGSLSAPTAVLEKINVVGRRYGNGVVLSTSEITAVGVVYSGPEHSAIKFICRLFFSFKKICYVSCIVLFNFNIILSPSKNSFLKKEANAVLTFFLRAAVKANIPKALFSLSHDIS